MIYKIMHVLLINNIHYIYIYICVCVCIYKSNYIQLNKVFYKNNNNTIIYNLHILTNIYHIYISN